MKKTFLTVVVLLLCYAAEARTFFIREKGNVYLSVDTAINQPVLILLSSEELKRTLFDSAIVTLKTGVATAIKVNECIVVLLPFNRAAFQIQIKGSRMVDVVSFRAFFSPIVSQPFLVDDAIEYIEQLDAKREDIIYLSR